MKPTEIYNAIEQITSGLRVKAGGYWFSVIGVVHDSRTLLCKDESRRLFEFYPMQIQEVEQSVTVKTSEKAL